MTRANERLLKNQRGTSLIELTAALFVLTVGMFGVIQMYHFGLNKMHALNETTVAVQALQNEIETLRSVPFSELRNTDKGRFVSETPALSRLVNAKPAVTITDYGDSSKRLKRITVSITWTGENGRTIQKTVTTLIADKKAS
jgi:Tfp pilus assembly protein PilV